MAFLPSLSVAGLAARDSNTGHGDARIRYKEISLWCGDVVEPKNRVRPL
jgi:hypothetical protein